MVERAAMVAEVVMAAAVAGARVVLHTAMDMAAVCLLYCLE